MCSSSSAHRDARLWMGLVAFVIGAVILLQRFDLVPSETWDYLWPSILVISGLKIMIMTGMKESCCSTDKSCDSCGSDECDGEGCEMPMTMPMSKKPVAKKKSAKRK